MTNQQRVELLAAVEALSRKYPDWRLGQLIANVSGWTNQDVWDVEDEQLLASARLHLEQNPGPIPGLATPVHRGR